MVGRDIVLGAAAYGGLAIVGALIGVTIKGYFDHRRLSPLGGLSGNWKGQLTYLGARSGADRVTLRLHRSRPWEPAYWLNPRLLIGVIDYHGELACRGGFYGQNQLQLSYVADDVRRFGSLILSFDVNTGSLCGFLAGFHQDGNFAGNVALAKLNDAAAAVAPRPATPPCVNQDGPARTRPDQPQEVASP